MPALAHQKKSAGRRAFETTAAIHDEKEIIGRSKAAAYMQIPPEKRAAVRELANKNEFDFSEFSAIIAGLPMPAQIALFQELKQLTYVPPGAEEARAKGGDARGYKCGKAREKTMLLNGEVASSRDLDAASAGIRRLAEASAHLTMTLMTLGGGGALEAGLLVRGGSGVLNALRTALPIMGETARLLKIVDPKHASTYDTLSAVASVGGLVTNIAGLARGDQADALRNAIDVAGGLAQNGLTMASLAMGGCDDPETRAALVGLKTVLATVRAGATGAAPSLADVMP